MNDTWRAMKFCLGARWITMSHVLFCWRRNFYAHRFVFVGNPTCSFDYIRTTLAQVSGFFQWRFDGGSFPESSFRGALLPMILLPFDDLQTYKHALFRRWLVSIVGDSLSCTIVILIFSYAIADSVSVSTYLIVHLSYLRYHRFGYISCIVHVVISIRSVVS